MCSMSILCLYCQKLHFQAFVTLCTIKVYIGTELCYDPYRSIVHNAAQYYCSGTDPCCAQTFSRLNPTLEFGRFYIILWSLST